MILQVGQTVTGEKLSKIERRCIRLLEIIFCSLLPKKISDAAFPKNIATFYKKRPNFLPKRKMVKKLILERGRQPDSPLALSFGTLGLR
jgi:hypothetical protein